MDEIKKKKQKDNILLDLFKKIKKTAEDYGLIVKEEDKKI